MVNIHTMVEIREIDGFVNATQLCKISGTKFNDWYQTDSTKNLINALTKDLYGDDDTPSLVVNNKEGSWIHPRLATALAMSISSEFYLQVTEWIEEWKFHREENPERYLSALETIQTDQREREISDQLAVQLGGSREVETPVGRIDIVTPLAIIEVKESSKWKHAVGQILCYSVYYPDHEKVIYLFGEDGQDTAEMKKICSKYEIQLARWKA